VHGKEEKIMSMRDHFVSAMPYIIGVGIPIGGLLMASALPIAYDLKGSVGEMKSSLANIQKQIDSEEAQLKTLVSERGDSETDPKLILSRQGVPVEEGYSFAYVGQSVVVFPKTQAAEAKLVKSGYQRENLTPVIYGYVPRR
jgi:hypothetical protein